MGSVGDASGRVRDQRVGIERQPVGGAVLNSIPERREFLAEKHRLIQLHGPTFIGIANIEMVNAVALPGGHIMLFDKLIQEAKSPDELAGVLAHEIGHVRNRDTITAMVRQLGLSIILGGFSGDVGGALNGVLSLSYGRDAERSADLYSIAALRSANISPLPTAAFFGRLGGGKAGETIERSTSWMASHPISAERRTMFEQAARKGQAYRPSLTPVEWAAIRGACKQDKDVAPVSRFGI